MLLLLLLLLLLLQVPPGKKPFFRIPVFNYHNGYLSINYSDNYFLLSQRHAEVPRLTQHQYDAMKVGFLGGGGVLVVGGGCMGVKNPGPVSLLGADASTWTQGCYPLCVCAGGGWGVVVGGGVFLQ